MPFTYYLPVPNLKAEGCPPETSVKMVSFLVKPRMWIDVNTPVALVSCGEVNYEVLANGKGILHKFLKDVGSTLTYGENLAVVDAEGEDIPYGKPYSKAKKVAFP